jgi:hypothetical protein
MSRGRSSRRTSRPRWPRGRAPTLDARAVEAVTRFVRLLVRCGCAPKDIGKEVLKACRAVPKSWAQQTRTTVPEVERAAHTLTLWYSDPEYLDSSGNPRPLPLRGTGPSLESLSRRVDPRLDVREVLRHLLRGSVLRRVKTRYVPRDRVLFLHDFGPLYHSRSLRTLLAILSTLDHNGQSRSAAWFERFAVNPCIPVSQVPGFDQRLRRRGNRFIVETDADLLSCERARKPSEPMVCVGVGAYRFEEQPLARERPARRSRGRPP